MATKNNSIHINPSKEGTFRAAVGVKDGQKIKTSDESKILNADTGEKVKLSTGKTVTATPALKKKANFARNSKKWD